MLQNDAPTLGEKRQKSERFARDVLQFATFCDTSRLKVHFFTFRTRSRAGTPKIYESSQKSTKNALFLEKTTIHLQNKSGLAPGLLKQLLQNSTPTLHGNAKKKRFPRLGPDKKQLLRHLSAKTHISTKRGPRQFTHLPAQGGKTLQNKHSGAPGQGGNAGVAH